MRLIDADALLKELRERETELCRSGINLIKGGQSIYKIVKQQPTAYDVEKVLNELAENSERIDEFAEYNNQKLRLFTRRIVDIYKAIDIVERGE